MSVYTGGGQRRHGTFGPRRRVRAHIHSIQYTHTDTQFPVPTGARAVHITWLTVRRAGAVPLSQIAAPRQSAWGAAESPEHRAPAHLLLIFGRPSGNLAEAVDARAATGRSTCSISDQRPARRPRLWGRENHRPTYETPADPPGQGYAE